MEASTDLGLRVVRTQVHCEPSWRSWEECSAWAAASVLQVCGSEYCTQYTWKAEQCRGSWRTLGASLPAVLGFLLSVYNLGETT